MQEQVYKRIKLFEEGFSIKEVSQITGESYKRVESTSRLFRKNGGTLIKSSTRQFVVDNYFDEINTENKAYLLGFFLADGCIDGSKNRNGKCSNRLMLQNSIDDFEAIELFRKEICINNKLVYRNNPVGAKIRKPQVNLRWTSNYMTNILINKYNFFRKKAYEPTFKFPFELIPKKLHRHFIRGFFDGDGNVDFKLLQTNTGVITTRFQYGFVCNSPIFAKQLSDIICSISKEISGTISETKGKTTNWWVLRFNTHRKSSVDKRYIFYKYLYKNATIYLTRKKDKFDSFFEYRGKDII